MLAVSELDLAEGWEHHHWLAFIFDVRFAPTDTTANQVHDFRLLVGKESLYWEAWVHRATQVTDIVVPSLVRRVIHSLYVRDVEMGAWDLVSHCKTEHQKVRRQSCGPASTKGTSIKSLHRTAVFVIMSD